jgi:phosphatidylglycerophosphatase A
MKKRLVLLLATGFGLGLSPVASGTAGSLLGVAIAYFVLQLPLLAQVAVSALLVCIAIPICDKADQFLGKHDDGRIVADEYLTFPICMIGLSWSPWVVVMAFVVCRFFDIVKPAPARQCEAFCGGLGIVLDDVMASIYALGVNHLIVRVVWPLVAEHMG